MTTIALETLKESAKDIFKKHGGKMVYATSDGNIFLEASKNAAELHTKTAKVTLYEIQNEDYQEPLQSGAEGEDFSFEEKKPEESKPSDKGKTKGDKAKTEKGKGE